MKTIALWFFLVLALSPMAGGAQAADLLVPMAAIAADGTQLSIGTIKLRDTTHGLVLTPDLSGLTPGLHGFHVHAGSDCGPGLKDGQMAAGMAAGGHFDPAGSGAHQGPYGAGHLGDLPALYANPDGRAVHPVLAPRVKIADIRGRALMIHAGGDNYADQPQALGGGGARVACGLIP